mmetsp:Transcript_59161/g.157454  ORF Transcript_59161/g.157454 Transcript_59161/m.157454 type:complete len:105 (+) Transcript_59161:1975-2289(+)
MSRHSWISIFPSARTRSNTIPTARLAETDDESSWYVFLVILLERHCQSLPPSLHKDATELAQRPCNGMHDARGASVSIDSVEACGCWVCSVAACNERAHRYARL